MGMSKDELSDIRLRYIKEELHILFKEKFSQLKRNLHSTNTIFLIYDKFTFEYGYTNANDDTKSLDNFTAIYENIKIDGTERELRNTYTTRNNLEDEIITKRIAWILERI